jgi:hypothetical protein
LGFINVLHAIFLKLCTYLGFLFLFQLREVFGLGLIGVDKRLNLVYFVGHVLVYDIFSLDFFFCQFVVACFVGALWSILCCLCRTRDAHVICFAAFYLVL